MLVRSLTEQKLNDVKLPPMREIKRSRAYFVFVFLVSRARVNVEQYVEARVMARTMRFYSMANFSHR